VVAIRPLQPADLDAYKALRDAMLAAHAEAFTSDAATERERPAHHYLNRLGLDRGDGGEFTLGAFAADAALVGAVTCERDMRAKVRHIGHVAGMMVRDRLQGRGIGRALIEACIARAHDARGLELLTLNVTSTNLPALHLYQSVGFIRYGRLEHALKLDGRYHAKDQMVLVLGSR
jgi:ribosomal protein S18 acetylase RimI-like enzyme